MSTFPRKKLFALAGEAQKNPDGSSRQATLQKAMPGEQIWLRRDAGNAYDENCVVAVDREDRAIGVLSRDDAALIAPLLDAGLEPRAFIHELTGGMPDYPNFGCVISIIWENRVKPEPRRLRPEQEYYEHAPIWEKPRSRSVSSTKARKSSAGILKKLFKALIK